MFAKLKSLIEGAYARFMPTFWLAMKPQYQWAFGIAIVVTLWLLTGVFRFGGHAADSAAAQAKTATTIPSVRVAALTAVLRNATIVVQGRTQALHAVDVRAEVEGVVKALHFEKGDRVKKDEVLCEIKLNDRGAKAIAKVSLQLLPTASTGAASAVTSSSATASGTVNPQAAATTVTFQYGTTPGLGLTASAGTLPASGAASPVSAGLTGLPAGTLIYYRAVATNPSGTANGAIQTFTTSGAPPPGSTITVGNQQIKLTTPSACVSKAGRLRASLSSTTIPRSRGAKLRFLSAAFYLDKGVRHIRHHTKRLGNGKKKTVTVVVYLPNRTVHRLPATVRLSVAGLRSGTHSLKVVLTYSKRVTKRGRSRTVKVRKTLKVRFAVC